MEMDRCFDFHQINADNDTHTHTHTHTIVFVIKAYISNLVHRTPYWNIKEEEKKKKIGNNTLQPANYDHYYKLLPIKRC